MITPTRTLSERFVPVRVYEARSLGNLFLSLGVMLGTGLVRLTVTRRTTHPAGCTDLWPSTTSTLGHPPTGVLPGWGTDLLSRGDATVADAKSTHNRRARLVPALLATCVVLGGCGGGSSDSSRPSTTTQPSETEATTAATRVESTTTVVRSTTTERPRVTTTTTPTSGSAGLSAEERLLVQRYVGYWDARFAANSGTPNPKDPALAEFATGPQLAVVVAETQKNLDAGLAFKPRAKPANERRVTVISIKGDQAVVQECFVDDGLVIRRDTGAAVDDKVATHNVRGELTRVNGVWRVSKAELIQRWEGVAGCAREL